MRLWPFASAPRAKVEPVAPSPAMQDALRASVEDVFAVHGQGHRGAGMIFSGGLLVEPAHAVPLLEARLRPYGYTPFLSREHGATWLQVLPLGGVAARARPWLNVLLFALTLVSTIAAGSFVAGWVPWLT